MYDQPNRKRGQRGPGKRPKMALLTVRVPQDVAEYYRSKPKYTVHLREVLIAAVVKEVPNEQD